MRVGTYIVQNIDDTKHNSSVYLTQIQDKFYIVFVHPFLNSELLIYVHEEYGQYTFHWWPCW